MTFICLIIQSRISLYCSGIDGYLISAVSNGCYGEDNYCMFTHPIISFVCSKLAIMLPYADCYSLVILAFMVFSLFFLFYLIFSQVDSIYKRTGLVLTVICYVFSTCNGLTMRFTIQAGFCMFVGLLLVSMTLHNKTNKFVLPGILCCMFGCMIREQAAYTLIPFFGLIVLYELILNRKTFKEFCLKCIKYVGVLTICVLVLFITNKCFYNQNEYIDSIKYNSARSTLVDYPVKDWESIKDDAIGYSENDYYAVTHYIWEDSDIIDNEYLEGISKLANNSIFTKAQEIESLPRKLRFLAQSILYNTCLNLLKFAWFEIGLIILLISGYLFIKNKDLLIRLMIALNLMGYLTIIVFFALLGREVALKELLLGGPLLVFFYLIFVTKETDKSVLNRRNIFIVALAFYITLQPFMGQKWFSPAVDCLRFVENKMISTETIETIEKNVYGNYKGIPFSATDQNSLKDVFFARKTENNAFLLDEMGENDELYIWNVHNLDEELAVLQNNNKLPSSNMLAHNVAIGEWVSGQVYFKEHLDNIGAPNLMKALLYRPDTFYVGKDEDIVHQWLKEHYSESVKIEHVKNVGKYPVWHFYE